MTFSIYFLIILIIVLSMDAFAAGLSYGMENVQVPFSSLAIIALLSGSMLTASLFAGNVLLSLIPQGLTKGVSFLVLFLLSLYKFYDAIPWFHKKKDGLTTGNISRKVNKEDKAVLSGREAAVLAAALWGALVEKAEGFTGVEITYVMMGMGCLAFTGTALLNALAKNTLPELIALPATTGGFLTAIIYLGFISSILAFIFSTKSIQLIGMNRVATFLGVNAVVSILAGVLFLKESFSTAQMAGVALILAGVYVANLHQDQPEEPEPSMGT